MNNVSIATKPLVYGTFRHMKNTQWNAIAEYIDNSIASYEKHKEILQKINEAGKLHIRITIDATQKIIIIEDDAFGIEEENYERAFELANIPLDASGLNEFGMGMKISSVWLSNLWTVDTSSYGEEQKKIFRFDLKKVMDEEMTTLPIEESYTPKSKHYTRIILQDLTENAPSTPKQISRLVEHLSVIYTQFIRSGEVDIFINDEKLKTYDLEPLYEPYYKNKDTQDSILWKFPIDFKCGKYSAKGFIGLLKTMSTSKDNGFLLFRRGRVIAHGGEERYRPTELCGQPGSPLDKRIFGELDLDGFSVSFTKNAFQEDANFEILIQSLKQHILKHPEIFHDIFGQGTNYKKANPSEIKSVVKGLEEAVKKQTEETINLPSIDELVTKEKADTAVSAKMDVTPNLFTNQPIQSINRVQPVKLGDKYTKIHISFVELENESYFIDFNRLENGEYCTTVNLKHQYFIGKGSMLASKESQDQLVYFITAMSLTCLRLRDEGKETSAWDFLTSFNAVFGKN